MSFSVIFHLQFFVVNTLEEGENFSLSSNVQWDSQYPCGNS